MSQGGRPEQVSEQTEIREVLAAQVMLRRMRGIRLITDYSASPGSTQPTVPHVIPYMIPNMILNSVTIHEGRFLLDFKAHDHEC